MTAATTTEVTIATGLRGRRKLSIAVQPSRDGYAARCSEYPAIRGAGSTPEQAAFDLALQVAHEVQAERDTL